MTSDCRRRCSRRGERCSDASVLVDPERRNESKVRRRLSVSARFTRSEQRRSGLERPDDAKPRRGEDKEKGGFEDECGAGSRTPDGNWIRSIGSFRSSESLRFSFPFARRPRAFVQSPPFFPFRLGPPPHPTWRVDRFLVRSGRGGGEPARWQVHKVHLGRTHEEL